MVVRMFLHVRLNPRLPDYGSNGPYFIKKGFVNTPHDSKSISLELI